MENPYAPPQSLQTPPQKESPARARLRRRRRLSNVLSILFAVLLPAVVVPAVLIAGRVTGSDAIGNLCGAVSGFAYGILFVWVARKLWGRAFL